MSEQDPNLELSPPKRSLWERRLAAQVAVAASRRTGRPVDPRVKKLAESKLGEYDPDQDYRSNT